MSSRIKNFGQQHEMRAKNRYMVLDAIARGLRTRRQIQFDSGLSWGTVSNCVAELVAEGSLVLDDDIRQDVFINLPQRIHGRNSYCYFSSDSNLIAGVCINCDHVKMYVCTADMSESHTYIEKNRNINSVTVLKNMIKRLLKKSGADPEAFAVMTIALTGAFDRKRAIWHKTSHLPQVKDWDLSPLYKLLPGKIIFEHDIISKARSIMMKRPEAGMDFAFCHFGEGVGLALCRNWEFQEGCRGFAGEIGHLPYLDESHDLESIVSLRGLKEFAEARGYDLTDERCWEFLKPHLLWSGIAVVNMFDPEVLLVGGELIDKFAYKMPAFAEALKEKSWMSGPEKIYFYTEKECDTAFGAAFAAKETLLIGLADE